MTQEKPLQKPTQPSGVTRVTVSFLGTGPDEGKSLKDIVKAHPGGRLFFRQKPTPQKE